MEANIADADETTELDPSFLFLNDGVYQDHTTLSDSNYGFSDDDVYQDYMALSDTSPLFPDNSETWDPMADSTSISSFLPADNTVWPEPAEQESTFLSSDYNLALDQNADTDCELNQEANMQTVDNNKVRREASCRAPPTGQAEETNPESLDEDFPNFNEFMDNQAKTIYFPENDYLCPELVFKKSSIPVLCPEKTLTIITHLPFPYVTLLDVYPRSFQTTCKQY
jgi:hypothetical protein